MVSAYHRMSVEDGVNGPAERTLSLPMNDPNFENALFTASPDVFLHHVGSVLRPKGVKVDAPVDRDFDQVCLFRHLFKPRC